MCSRILPSPSTTTRRLGVDQPILKKLAVEDGLSKMVEMPYFFSEESTISGNTCRILGKRL